MSTHVRQIGDICEQIRGVSYDRTDASDVPEQGKRPILRANNITDEGLIFDDLVYVPRARINERQMLRQGDILLAASSGSLDVVGKAALCESNFEGGFGAFCKVLRPSKEAYARYLSYFFRSPQYRHTISRLAAGANINNLKNEHLDNLTIPLPPLSEQKRIAAILDKADAIRRKRRESLKLLDDFLRSVFLDMFGDPVTNPKGWAIATIGALLKTIEAGCSISGEQRIKTSCEWGVLRISAVTWGRYEPRECKTVALKDLPDNPILPKRGDLLFSRANTRELVAACCLVDKEVPQVFLPDKLWRITPHFDRVSVEYMCYLFQNPGYRKLIARQATGTSGSMLNVSMDKLRNLRAPLPPIGAQKRFGNIVWKTYASEALADTGHITANTLFHALLQHAFRGEL